MKPYILGLLVALCMQTNFLRAQNELPFRQGENLTYDLYFRFGILMKKAGYARLTVSPAQLSNGTTANRMQLVSHSTGTARSFFELDDTLSCVMDSHLRALSFSKNAHEGDEHTIERVSYSYQTDGKIRIHARRVKNGTEKHNLILSASQPTYDMLSIVYYARALDYSAMQVNSKSDVEFVSGRRKVHMRIIYDGTETIKANNDVKYVCHRLSLVILDNAFSNPEKAMRVWITNDSNRMPVQIESKLKVGSTKALLKSYSGLAYPIGK